MCTIVARFNSVHTVINTIGACDIVDEVIGFISEQLFKICRTLQYQFNNYDLLQSGKPDDVKCLEHTQSAEDPPVGEVKNHDENKCGKNNIVSDDARYRRRRKTRRGKSKRRKVKPYSKQTWQQRRDDNRTRRAYKERAQIFAHGQPVAPYNTNQFLMDDHNDVQNLDVQLSAVAKNPERIRSNAVYQRPSRVRDSSLSVDSDEDFFYSSPEDEEEFLTKEFSNTYEDLHAERLHQMSKNQLIQEYLQLEEKIDTLQKRLQKSQTVEISGQINDDVDSQMDDESSSKVQLFQQEINRLLTENEQLRRENEHLRESCKQRDRASSVSSVDSESDSTCSSASDSSDNSDGETGSESKDSVVRTCDQVE